MIRLYHGSTVAVRKPSLRPGRPNADFGKGFYTTSVMEQAVRWAHIRQEREYATRAVVSVYEFDESLLDADWNILVSLARMNHGSCLLPTVANLDLTLTI